MDTVITISQEPGVKDLPLRVRAKFAKALLAERQAGQTTPEALVLLEDAIKLEEVSNSL